ncbi:hypothetical protein VTO42DRAFT_8830 [Malbranchea cinnamomea]
MNFILPPLSSSNPAVDTVHVLAKAPTSSPRKPATCGKRRIACGWDWPFSELDLRVIPAHGAPARSSPRDLASFGGLIWTVVTDLSHNPEYDGRNDNNNKFHE